MAVSYDQTGTLNDYGYDNKRYVKQVRLSSLNDSIYDNNRSR